MKLDSKLERVSNYFFITSIIFMIIMIGCALPSNSGSSSNKNGSKKLKK